METQRSLQEINDEYKDILVPVVVIIAVLMVLGIFGNPLVIYFYGIRKKATTSYIFIVSLSVFDLMSSLISMPIEILDIIYFYTFPDKHACRTLRFINYFSSIASGTTLIAIAVDRYKKICKPFDEQITLKIAKFVILFVVAFSLFSSWPSLALYDVVTVNISEQTGMFGHDCRMLIDASYRNYIFAYQIYLFLLFFITLVLLLVIYTLVGKKLFHLRSFQFYSSSRRTSSLRPTSGLTVGSDVTAATDRKMFSDDEEIRHGDFSSFKDAPHEGRLSTTAEGIPNNSRPTSLNSISFNARSVKVTPEFNEISPTTNDTGKSVRQTVSFIEPSNRETICDTTEAHHSAQRTPVQNFRNSSDKPSAIVYKEQSAKSRISSDLRESSFISKTRDANADDSMDLDKKKLRAQNINTRRYTIIAISISIAFVFSYLPYLILSLWTAVFVNYDPHTFSSSELIAIELFLRSFLFNSVCNPIIYGLLNSEFKNMVRNILKTVFCCGKGVKEFRSSNYPSVTS